MSSVSAVNSLLSSTSSSADSGANSAVDLSSILASSVGASTPGIDVNAAVAAALFAARAPERLLQTQQATLAAQATALTAIRTATTALSADLTAFNSLNGPLAARTVASSNPNAVTATAALGTVTGNHTVAVSQLATTGSSYSQTVADATTALPVTTFTLTANAGASTTITTGSGVNTLNDVAASINGQNLGVTASIITDASGARLALVANASGSAADFSIAAQPNFAFTQAVQGQNAALVVDGVPITSATNTVTGAIGGVTLNLLSPTLSAAPANLSIAADTTTVATAINKFVNDYNTAIGLVNAQFAATGTSLQGVLGSDPTVRNLQSSLLQALNYTAPSSSSTVSTLNDLGISTAADGTLNLDPTTLANALSNHAADIQSFFQGVSLNGFANSLITQLGNFTSPGSGAFSIDLSSIGNTSSGLAKQISDFESIYIANQRNVLTAQFSKAEAALQQLPAQQAQIQAELGNSPSSH